MRYGILSDIHGNVHALRAVLRSIEQDGVDQFLCLGDLVGYGPYPNECVDIVAGLGAACVAGNHDLIAVGALTDERCGPLARAQTGWTRDALTDGTRRYLAELPGRARVGDVVLAHGSPDDPERYVTYPDLANRVLDRLADEESGYRVLALGHTHHPWAYGRDTGTQHRGRRPGSVRLDPGQRYLVNPGSVGQSRDRSVAARYLVLDLGRRQAHFRAVPYDVRGHVQALVRAGLPARSHHLPTTMAEHAERALKKVTRRATAVRRMLRG